MIKMDKKGFMMAELVVVSSIVLITLVSLYTSFNKIYSIYKSRVGYYDVATLYRAGYYKDILNEYGLMDVAKEKALNNKIVTVYNNGMLNGLFLSLPSDIDLEKDDNAVFLIYNNKNKIDSSVFGSIVVNSTFKDYVDYLKDSVDFSGFEYMLIMERCNLDTSGNRNINSCNYSYLEIFPESNNNNDDNSDDDNSDDVVKYIVKYDANGGIDKGVSEQEKIAGESLRLKDEIPIRSGYGFMGWSTSKNSIYSSYLDFGPKYIDGDSLQYYNKDKSETLYAVWKNLYDSNYTLIFDVNMFTKNVNGFGCNVYTGKDSNNINDIFPNPVTVYIYSSSGQKYISKENVNDFFEEVNVGDKWEIWYNNNKKAEGIIGDGKNYMYYGGETSIHGDNWYYFEYVVDLSNNGFC